MKKVLQYIPAYKFGGIESFTYSINKELKNDYHFVYLVERDLDKNTIEKLKKINADFVRIPNMVKESFFGHICAIRKVLKDGKFDVVHVHDCDNRFFVMVFAKIYGIKTRIYHIHSKNVGGSKLNRIVKKIGIRVNAMLANIRLSCSNESALNKKIKKYELVNNCIDANKFKYNKSKRNEVREQYNIDSDNKVILFVGRLEKVKNVSYLIDVMSKIPTGEQAKYNLIIVGDGRELKALEDKMRQLGLQNIIFAGPQRDLSRYYSASDFLCMPSLSEGFPITLLEAQAAGLECIVSENVPKVVKITPHVRFVGIQPSDMEKWLDVILHAKVASGKNRVHSAEIVSSGGYDVKATARKMCDIYDGIASIGVNVK